MPQAKTSSMCPQCGCIDALNPHTSSMGYVKFRCGECVYTEIDGAFQTDYHCQTIPDRVPMMELALSQALDSIISRRDISSQQYRELERLNGQVTPTHRADTGTQTIRSLISRGMVRAEGREMYIMTAWGRAVFSRLQQEESYVV